MTRISREKVDKKINLNPIRYIYIPKNQLFYYYLFIYFFFSIPSGNRDPLFFRHWRRLLFIFISISQFCITHLGNEWLLKVYTILIKVRGRVFPPGSYAHIEKYLRISFDSNRIGKSRDFPMYTYICWSIYTRGSRKRDVYVFVSEFKKRSLIQNKKITYNILGLIYRIRLRKKNCILRFYSFFKI